MVLARAAAALCLCALCALACAEDRAIPGCGAVRQAYREMGFSSGTVPENGTAGDHLRVCVRNFTCCSGEMEQNFMARSKHELQKFVDQATEDLRNTFESRYKRFDDFFLELLEKTERSLNEMFVRTYGNLYTRHADVFQRLFSELKRFYSGASVNLEDAIGDFWSRLMERMFQLLNSQYDINDDYMECANKHADDLKPFGDVPKQVKAQVSRAFVVARTFVQGLHFGQEVTTNASKVNVSAVCVSSVTDMLYCPYCQGVVVWKPCRDHCLRVLKLCIRQQLGIHEAWTRYIDAMLLLVESLEGPFNIESVMEPIDVKISDAIMTMQEKTVELSHEVFRGCGWPKLLEKSRVSRDISDMTDVRLTATESSGTSLQKLVLDVKGKLMEFKSFWTSLPELVCRDEGVAAAGDESRCRGGEQRGWNVSDVQDQEFIDFPAMVSTLRRAYNGYETHYDDSSDEMSGSGSGSGCMDSCLPPPPSIITETPQTEWSSTPRLHPCRLLLFLLLFVLSILTSQR